MNNKGFAITSIIYGLMLLFVVVLTSFLSVLVGRNRRIDALLESVYSSVVYEEIVVTNDAFTTYNAYATEVKGLYLFEYNNCRVYLPKGVVIVTGEVKDVDDASVQNKLFYKENGGGSDLASYKELTCLN